MGSYIAVEAHDIGKLYRVYPSSFGRIVEWATRGKAKRHQEKWALRGVSFDVPKGSALGIVGMNGAGKSTLLKILTGTTTPTTGSYRIEGRVGSLLELGAGFHPEFSGRDNVFMNANIMGIPKREVRERFSELADFAELGEYLDRPVRTYSTGMAMRLAFSVAMLSHPDVLILDEVLAVGDQHFQTKCMDRIRSIRRSGTTILLVSHALAHVRQMCDRAIWIHGGMVAGSGDSTRVTDEYVNFTFARSGGQAAQIAKATGGASLLTMPHLAGIRMSRADEWESLATFKSSEVVDIHLGYRNPGGTGALHVGIIVNRADDLQVFSSRTSDFGLDLSGTEGEVCVRVPLRLTSGEYYLSGYLLDETCEQVLDQRLAWYRFTVDAGGHELGVWIPDSQWVELAEVK